MTGRWFAKKTAVPELGIVCASAAEAKRARELALMQSAGVIDSLTFQPRFRFVVNGVYVGAYTADASYRVVATGQVVIEDVKSKSGYRARGYATAKRLMKAIYGHTVTEHVA